MGGRTSVRTLAFKTAMRVRDIVGDLFLLPPGYSFKTAKSVGKQVIEVDLKGKQITLEADRTTPLYDMVAEIIDYDCYQLSRLRIEGSADSIILDIGANIGVFSVVVGSQYNGQIYAYEPIQTNLEILRRNLEINGLNNVKIMPYAAGCHDGEMELVMDPEMSVSARAPRYKSDKSAHKVKVETRTLSRILHELGDKEIDLIKMDCEGCEYGLLDCLKEEEARRIKAMTFELHTETLNWKKGERNRQVRSVIQRLQGWGFKTIYKPEMFGRRELHHLLAVR